MFRGTEVDKLWTKWLSLSRRDEFDPGRQEIAAQLNTVIRTMSEQEEE